MVMTPSKDRLSLSLSSYLDNTVDYLKISQNPKDGSWDQNPVKTALCLRAMNSIDEIENPDKVEKWLREWIDEETQDLDLTDQKTQHRIKAIIEGVAEVAYTLDGLDTSSLEDFFSKTMQIDNNSNKGSWESEIVLTAKVVRALKSNGLNVPKETDSWLKEQMTKNKANLAEICSVYLMAEIRTDRLERKINREIERKDSLSMSELSVLLQTEELDIDYHKYSTKLREKVEESSSIKINATLTKALMQAFMLRKSGFSEDEVKDRINTFTGERWDQFIESIDEDAIGIKVSDMDDFLNGNRSIIDFANSVIALSSTKSALSVEVEERYFNELKYLEENYKRREFIDSPIIIGKKASISLGVLSSISIYLLASQFGILSLKYNQMPYGLILTYTLCSYVIAVGYTGSIIYTFNKMSSKLQKAMMRVDEKVGPIEISKETKEHPH